MWGNRECLPFMNETEPISWGIRNLFLEKPGAKHLNLLDHSLDDLAIMVINKSY